MKKIARDGGGCQPPTQDRYGTIVAGLATQGWACVPEFWDAELCERLKQDAQRAQRRGAFQRAAIGRGATMQIRRDVRGDHIVWFDNVNVTEPQRLYLEEMERFRAALNRNLFMGLYSLEAHYAVYPPGAAYHRHLDQHQGSDQRLVTCIAYLNDGWDEADAGKLRLYIPGEGDERYLEVLPQAGTMVCFLSAEFYHEVLPARRDRYSLTGWFRRRAPELLL